MALLGAAIALVASLSMVPLVQAQQACIGSRTNPAMAHAIQQLEAQGATVTCDSHNMYVLFPDGTFFNLAIPDNGAISLYAFNPLSGQSTHLYILNGSLWIQDNVYGLINAGDGWFDIFYPVGNPFSASIQNPMQVLFQQNLPPEIQELISGWGPRRPPFEPILE
jgi:hypothetical protein